MRQAIETRNGRRMVDVVTLKSRAPAKPKGLSGVTPLDLSDVIERVARVRDMARTMQGVSRVNPGQFAEEKSDLVRAIGRLEDDLRRRGVA